MSALTPVLLAVETYKFIINLQTLKAAFQVLVRKYNLKFNVAQYPSKDQLKDMPCEVRTA